MGNENYNASLNQASNRVMTRIDHDIDRVKHLTGQVGNATRRLGTHARSLGYFEPPTGQGAPSTNAPTPVVTTLADALAELERAIDAHNGTLNVFD